MIRQAIIISDLHCGCQYGLCPPRPIPLDGGGKYIPSALQGKVWQWWRKMWDEWIPQVTREEEFALVINGDTTDGRHHGSVTQISQNIHDQFNIAREILEPFAEKVNGRFFMIRGTEAHTGVSGENEEMLADVLGAIPDSSGNHARYELWLRLVNETGPLAHIMHHIGTAGSTAYEPTALAREYSIECEESGRWGNPLPDFVVRSHRHRFSKVEFPTQRGYGESITTPGWQLKTPFTWKIAGGRMSLPQFGGILIRKGDEEHYSRAFVQNITRSAEVMV